MKKIDDDDFNISEYAINARRRRTRSAIVLITLSILTLAAMFVFWR